MRVLSTVAIVSSLIVAGCSSVEVRDFKPAQGPQGIHMVLTLNGDVIDGNKISGELLAVRGDGVILNVVDYPDSASAPITVVLVPFWMMDTAELEQMGRTKVESLGKERNEIYLERLRLLSRFPQGLSDELLARLLAEVGQEELEVPHRAD